MTTPIIVGLVILGVVVSLLVLGATAKLVLYLMKDLKANSFGLESARVWQVRGNGGLVLTAEYLHFFMFLPKGDLRVPLGAITELTFTKSHLGKATIYDLLKVRFSVEDKSDSIAWYLTDPPAWKNRIEDVKAGKATNQRP